jgi:hypothetical protein
MCWGCLIQGALFCHVAEHYRCHRSTMAYETCVHWEFKSPNFFLCTLIFIISYKSFEVWMSNRTPAGKIFQHTTDLFSWNINSSSSKLSPHLLQKGELCCICSYSVDSLNTSIRMNLTVVMFSFINVGCLIFMCGHYVLDSNFKTI